MSRETLAMSIMNTLGVSVPWGIFSKEDRILLLQDAQGEGGKAFRDFLRLRLWDIVLKELDAIFSEDFKRRILLPARNEFLSGVVQPATSGPSLAIPDKGMTHAEVRARLRDLGGNDVFPAAPWLLYFAGEVKKFAGDRWDLRKDEAKQWYVEGENEDGSHEIFAVDAYWLSDDGKWRVHASQFADRWLVRGRAFSAATASQAS